MKVTDNFSIEELVHPDIFNHPAIGERCVDFIHPEAAPTLELIKTATNDVITINDWMWKGVEAANYVDSGLRMPVIIPSKEEVVIVLNGHDDFDTTYDGLVKLFKGVGAPLSSHREGCGFDLKFKNMTAAEAYRFIIDNQHLFPHITRMENINKTPSWVHIEIGAARAPGVNIVVFNP